MKSFTIRFDRTGGFTYIELLLSLTIIAAIGTIAAPRLTHRASQASMQITLASLQHVRDAIIKHYRNDMFESLPFPEDPARTQHPQLKYLFDNPIAFTAPASHTNQANLAWSYDPVTMRGWSGPYIDQSIVYRFDFTRGYDVRYGLTGDPAPSDGWGNPIVLQQPVFQGGLPSRTSLTFARLVSPGPDGILQTPPDVPEPTLSQMGDDVVLYLRSH